MRLGCNEASWSRTLAGIAARMTGFGGSIGLYAATSLEVNLGMKAARPIFHISGSSEFGPLAHSQKSSRSWFKRGPSGFSSPASPESQQSMGLFKLLDQAQFQLSEMIPKRLIPRSGV